MKRFLMLLSWILISGHAAPLAIAQDERPVIELEADLVDDKIRGGMLGQILGNLNGLPHEFKYISKPGNVEQYTPGLPDGARTDDDTDIEWVYLQAIAHGSESILPAPRIAELWKRHINRRIFCANLYARQLMDLGLEPPWTGHPALNPWAEFNISGQFLCESFGLMAPAMPQTAARLGIHYTHVGVDGEPIQTTQLFTTMLATAFVETDLDRIIDAGLAAVDPACEIAPIVRETRVICGAHPDDWRAARADMQKRWQVHGGIRDSNGYELNTACTIAALIYGRGDFAETLRLAFNLGWDCDNNAATAGAILGVLKGRLWMDSQGWKIADVYANTTRDDMPQDETISGLENLLIECARIVIKEQGGEAAMVGGRRVYRIRSESPSNVEPLPTRSKQAARVRDEFLAPLKDDLAGPPDAKARAVYLGICLDEPERLARQFPEAWPAAIEELKTRPNLMRVLFKAPKPSANGLHERARQAGLQPPEK